MWSRISRFTPALVAVGLSACGSTPEPIRPELRSMASFDGTTVQFAVAGLDNPGPAILFLHGWSNNWTFARPRFDRFAEAYPVVALDLPGFGASGADREEWGVPAYARDVQAVVSELGLNEVVLVGHSMGGAVAIASAALIGPRVVGTVIIDWLQDPHTQYDEQFFEDYRTNYSQGFQDPSWVRSVAFSEDSPEENVLRYIENMPRSIPDHWWAILRSAFEWASAELVTTLGRVESPVLAINTDEVPTDVEAYQALVPSFKAIVVEDRRHIGVLWEEPEAVDRPILDLAESVGR